MSYQIAPGDPIWTSDIDNEMEHQIAAFAKANGIVNQAAWLAFVASLSTLPQMVVAMKAFLASYKCVP